MAVCNATDIRAPAGGGPAKQQQRRSPLLQILQGRGRTKHHRPTHVAESSQEPNCSSCRGQAASNGNSRGEFHAVCPLSLFPLWDGGQSSAGCRSTSILSLLYYYSTTRPAGPAPAPAPHPPPNTTTFPVLSFPSSATTIQPSTIMCHRRQRRPGSQASCWKTFFSPARPCQRPPIVPSLVQVASDPAHTPASIPAHKHRSRPLTRMWRQLVGLSDGPRCSVVGP